MHSLRNVLRREEQRLNKLIEKIEAQDRNKENKRAKVLCAKGRYRYYIKSAGAQKYEYVSANEKHRVKEVFQQEYYKKTLPVLKKRQDITQNLIKLIDEEEQIFKKMSAGRRALITPTITNCEEYINRWQSVEYVGKPFGPDDPELYTKRGERVRSKTERMIANTLYDRHIPYRYEYPIKVKGYGTIYADFLILDPATGQEYIWEHFGIMDDKDYCNKSAQKLRTYNHAGIILGDRLIVTIETKQVPLDTQDVENILKTYFGEVIPN